jgi:hypothetical protein
MVIAMKLTLGEEDLPETCEAVSVSAVCSALARAFA